MTRQLNIFATTAFSLIFLWKRLCRFVTPDLILIPALGCLWMIMLWSMLSTFFSTLMPSPCLPAIMNTAISVLKVSKDYLEVVRALWNYPHADTLEKFVFPKVASGASKTFASI